ncbi:putative hem peroxidase, retrotransposon gag domain, hem peroxidase superfamily [Helianthus anomalus]
MFTITMHFHQIYTYFSICKYQGYMKMKREGSMFLSFIVILAVCGAGVEATGLLPPESSPLIRHYYKVHNTCANVEPFVRHQVKSLYDKDKTIAPKLIKLLYADCMVNFDGREHEDPGRHIAAFLAVCSTFRITGVSEDAIRLRLFPFSLRDKARAWLMSLPAGSIRTWNQLAEQFMQKYFPPEKTNKLRNRIVSFRQDEGESLHAAWERFKDLLIDVPHHGFSKRQLVLTFYQGLCYNTQERLDVNAGGDLGTKTPTEAYDIIEKAVLKSSSRWEGDRGRSSSSRSGVHVVDDYTAITAQISALTSRFDKSQMIAHAGSGCDQCGVSHEPGACFQGVVYEGHEEVDFVSNQVRPQNNPYSNTYNPGWRNHPNFRVASERRKSEPVGVHSACSRASAGSAVPAVQPTLPAASIFVPESGHWE